jgi:hypothetical protein
MYEKKIPQVKKFKFKGKLYLLKLSVYFIL